MINQIINRTDLIKALENEGLLDQNSKRKALEIVEAGDTTSTPWFVQILSGFGAWIAAVMFIITFFLAGGSYIFDSEIGAITMGAILLIIVFIVSIKSSQSKSVFIEQLMLATSFSGHFLFFLGLSFKNDYRIILSGSLAAILSLCFIFFYKNRIHKFISTGIFLISIGAVLEELGLNPFSFIALFFVLIAALSSWMWMNESRFLTGKRQEIARPVQYALTLIFLIGGGVVERYHMNFSSFKDNFDQPYEIVPILPYLQFVSAGLFLILAYVIISILQRLKVDWKSMAGIGLLAFALIITFIFHQSPSILAALIVLLIGIERGNRILVPLAIFALITFYSDYYYSMDMTLMKKSLILMGSGLVMLAGGWIASRAGERS